MWFDETIQASESSLKNVLLETLFQLLGVVTQPKTKQQEAFFVDLLERTLLLMRTEIAKEWRKHFGAKDIMRVFVTEKFLFIKEQLYAQFFGAVEIFFLNEC